MLYLFVNAHNDTLDPQGVYYSTEELCCVQYVVWCECVCARAARWPVLSQWRGLDPCSVTTREGRQRAEGANSQPLNGAWGEKAQEEMADVNKGSWGCCKVCLLSECVQEMQTSALQGATREFKKGQENVSIWQEICVFLLMSTNTWIHNLSVVTSSTKTGDFVFVVEFDFLLLYLLTFVY